MRSLAVVLALAAGARAEEAPHPARVMPPAGRVSVKEAIEGGVRFLVENQNEDGSFGTHHRRTYEILCQVPGGHRAFRAATTALCWMGLESSVGHRPEGSRKARKRALAWLVENAAVKRETPWELYNIWAHAYGLRAVARALAAKAPGATPEELRKAASRHLEVIARQQTPDGGWGYYDFYVGARKPTWSTSFTTATTVIALKEAEAAGVVVPEKVLEKAVRNILRCRKPDGTYLYGFSSRYWPHGRISKPQGSSLRTQSCNLALRLCGRLGEAELRAGLDQLVANHRFAVSGVRRPIPHESWYAVSGYFYLYGQQYASMVLDHLTEADRGKYLPKVVEYVLKTRQPDGSFWDYPCYGYHKFYGTGYALMALAKAE